MSSCSSPVANAGDEGVELLQPFWSWEIDVSEVLNFSAYNQISYLVLIDLSRSQTTDKAFIFPLSLHTEYSNRENNMYWNTCLFEVFAPENSCVSGGWTVSHLLLKLLDREVDQKDKNPMDVPGINVVFCDVQMFTGYPAPKVGREHVWIKWRVVKPQQEILDSHQKILKACCYLMVWWQKWRLLYWATDFIWEHLFSFYCGLHLLCYISVKCLLWGNNFYGDLLNSIDILAMCTLLIFLCVFLQNWSLQCSSI